MTSLLLPLLPSRDDLASVLAAVSAHPLESAAAAFALFFLLQHWHVLPFTYHLRVLWSMVSTALFASRLRTLDDAVVTTHTVGWGSMDWNMHMNNSCYALEIDIQRYRWFMRLLHGSYGRYFDGGIAIANGGVTHYFLREMRWGQRYAITTRLVAADRKWMYLESRFTSLNGKTLFAVGLSRIVFKGKPAKAVGGGEGAAGRRAGGRVTVAPVDALRGLGYDTSALPLSPEGGSGLPSKSGAAAVPTLVAALLETLEPGEAASAATPRTGTAADDGGKTKRT
jgi:acyl-CoA thioesterase FadM